MVFKIFLWGCVKKMTKKSPAIISHLPNKGKGSFKIRFLAKKKAAHRTQTQPISASAVRDGHLRIACQQCAKVKCVAPKKKQNAWRNLVSLRTGANGLSPALRDHSLAKTVPGGS